jgi:hypothetical protein
MDAQKSRLQNELLALPGLGFPGWFLRCCGQVSAGRPDSNSGPKERKRAPQSFTAIRSHGSLLLQILILVVNQIVRSCGVALTRPLGSTDGLLPIDRSYCKTGQLLDWTNGQCDQWFKMASAIRADRLSGSIGFKFSKRVFRFAISKVRNEPSSISPEFVNAANRISVAVTIIRD